MKDFDIWNNLKKKIEQRDIKNLYVKERQIWRASVGLNIGHEIDGKNTLYERPVLILKKINKHTYFVAPLSSKSSDEHFSHRITVDENESFLSFHQVKIVDGKRLTRKMFTLDVQQFEGALAGFLLKYGNRLTAVSSDPEGLNT